MKRPDPIKLVQANERHQAFYGAMADAAISNKLTDMEIAALVGRMLGYNRGLGADGTSVPELVQAFRFNLREGFRAIRSGEVKPE